MSSQGFSLQPGGTWTSWHETPGLRRLAWNRCAWEVKLEICSLTYHPLLDTAFSVKLNCSADPTQWKMTLLHSYTWMQMQQWVISQLCAICSVLCQSSYALNREGVLCVFGGGEEYLDMVISMKSLRILLNNTFTSGIEPLQSVLRVGSHPHLPSVYDIPPPSP